MANNPDQLDLNTLNAAGDAVVAAIHRQSLEWQIKAAAAAFDGQFQSASNYENWAFAATIVAGAARSEITQMFIRAAAEGFRAGNRIAEQNDAQPAGGIT